MSEGVSIKIFKHRFSSVLMFFYVDNQKKPKNFGCSVILECKICNTNKTEQKQFSKQNMYTRFFSKLHL